MPELITDREELARLILRSAFEKVARLGFRIKKSKSKFSGDFNPDYLWLTPIHETVVTRKLAGVGSWVPRDPDAPKPPKPPRRRYPTAG